MRERELLRGTITSCVEMTNAQSFFILSACCRGLPVPANAPYQHLYDLRNPAARASSSEQNHRFDFFVLT